MNKERRKELDKAWDLLDATRDIVESCKDDEEDALFYLPEGIKNSERGEQMEEYISMMEDILGNLCDAIYTLSEIVAE